MEWSAGIGLRSAPFFPTNAQADEAESSSFFFPALPSFFLLGGWRLVVFRIIQPSPCFSSGNCFFFICLFSYLHGRDLFLLFALCNISFYFLLSNRETVIDGLRSSDGQRSIDTHAKSPNDANLIQSILFDYYYLSRERAGAFEIDFYAARRNDLYYSNAQ